MLHARITATFSLNFCDIERTFKRFFDLPFCWVNEQRIFQGFSETLFYKLVGSSWNWWIDVNFSSAEATLFLIIRLFQESVGWCFQLRNFPSEELSWETIAHPFTQDSKIPILSTHVNFLINILNLNTLPLLQLLHHLLPSCF